MNHLIQLEEKLDEFEFGIARATRVAASQLKGGKKPTDFTVHDNARGMHLQRTHTERRRKFLRRKKVNYGELMAHKHGRGSLGEAAIKALPRKLRRQIQSLPSEVRKEIFNKTLKQGQEMRRLGADNPKTLRRMKSGMKALRGK